MANVIINHASNDNMGYLIINVIIKNLVSQDQKDNTAVKSVDCSCRGTRLGSQALQNGP